MLLCIANIKRFLRIFVKTNYFASHIQSVTTAEIAADFSRSPVKTAATPECHPKEVAAARTMFSHPNMMTRLTALPRKTSTGRSTDSTAHLTITMDHADRSDVVA